MTCFIKPSWGFVVFARKTKLNLSFTDRKSLCKSLRNVVFSFQERVDGRRRVIRLLIAIIVSFALLCLPHHVRQLWSNWTPGYAHDIYGIKALFPDLAFLLLFMNSAVNPLLYALMSKKFRKAIKDVFGRKHIRDKKREQFVSSMRSTLTVATDNYSTTECGPT